MDDQRVRARSFRRIATIGCLYFAALALLLFWPTRVTRPFGPELAAVRSAVPYGDTLLEIAANVVVFMPLGALSAWLLPRGRRWLGIVAGVLVSCAAELIQATMLPDRVASWRDVLANSLGVIAGLAATSWITNWRAGRSE